MVLTVYLLGFFNLLDVNTKEQITEVDIHLADNIDLSNTGIYSLQRGLCLNHEVTAEVNGASVMS